MAASDETVAAAHDIYDFVFKKLRYKFPFMKAQAWARIAENLEKSAVEQIQAQEHAITTTKAAFDFFSIPPELRNQIYEYVLVGVDTADPFEIIRSSLYYLQSTRGTGDFGGQKLKWPALLCVNKQIRKEALPVYLGQNTFRLILNDYIVGTHCAVERDLAPWLAMLGVERAKLVKDILIKFRLSNTEQLRRQLPNQPPNAQYHPRGRPRHPPLPDLTRLDVLNAYGLQGYGLPDDAIRVQYGVPKDKNMELSNDGTSTKVARA